MGNKLATRLIKLKKPLLKEKKASHYIGVAYLLVSEIWGSSKNENNLKTTVAWAGIEPAT